MLGITKSILVMAYLQNMADQTIIWHVIHDVVLKIFGLNTAYMQWYLGNLVTSQGSHTETSIFKLSSSKTIIRYQ